MSGIKIFLSASLCALTSFANAAPRVVADIAPIHSLAAGVMAGAGVPRLLLPADADPHHHALRPSEAEMLKDAGLVLWAGESLSPWLKRPLEELANNAEILVLDEASGVSLIGAGQTGGHSHGHDHDHGHAEGADPHFWLDPRNAVAVTRAIAEALSRTDATNARHFRDQAEQMAQALGDLEAEIAGMMPAGSARYVVAHDALAYFEQRFGIEASAPLAPFDGAEARPKAMEAVRNRVLSGEITCVFTINGEGARAAARVAEGSATRVIDLDVLGASAPVGPEQYFTMMRTLARRMNSCMNR